MKFSIIIPTFNSEEYIQECLDNIFSIDYPKKDYEVIIVDGGSKDDTLKIIKKYDIKLVNSKNKSISNSRNLAAKYAKGRFLVFIDSDCVANKNLLKKSEKLLEKYDCCGAFYAPSKNAGWVAKTWLLIENKKKGIVDWLPAGTLIVNKSVFNQIKGFDEKLKTGEDFDFCKRLREKWYQIFNDPEIASIHLGQTDSLISFFKKEMWRGNSLIKGIKHHGVVKEELPSTILTFYHLAAIIFLIIVSFINMSLLIISLLLLLVPSSLLSLRKTIQIKKVRYFFYFWILIWVYQIARAISIIRYNQINNL